MESEKRKQRDEEVLNDGKRRNTKAEDDRAGKKAVTEDDEVEEFFAILRRIRVAVKYFEKGKGDGGRTASTLWSPSFERQDFHKVSSEREGVEENVGLDLNADPVFDPDSI